MIFTPSQQGDVTSYAVTGVYMTGNGGPVSQRWDAEYTNGRYSDAPSVDFTDKIRSVLAGAADVASWDGLYVGCGNGRNFIPLADSGLGILGIDSSPMAIRQLSERRPDLAERLCCVDFASYPESQLDYIISIQAFQHGTKAQIRGYFEKVARMLRSGGLFFLRVNSASTDIYFDHDICEWGRTGGFTVLYRDGPKRGLYIHFYSRKELDEMCGSFEHVVTPYEQVTERGGPKTGVWSQWEAVLRKK